jgi:DNA repair protein SbcC/Rad50
MIPLKLELRNFMAYRDADPLDLSGLHVVVLTGDNGAGKSTLLDAITWALWGYARARRDDELISQGASELRVALTFSEGRSVYQVVRTRRQGKAAKGKAATSSGTLDLFIRDDSDNTWRALSEPRMSDTQEKIVRLLNLSYETFINSAYLKQGRADEFTVRPPAQRKELLAEILSLGVWRDYEQRARHKLASIEQEKTRRQTELRAAEEELARLPEFERGLGEAQTALTLAQTALSDADQSQRALDLAREQIRQLRSQMTQTTERMSAAGRELERLTAERTVHATALADYDAALQAHAQIEQGYAALLQAREENERLNGKLGSLVELNARKSAAESEISAKRQALQTAVDAAQRQVESLREAARTSAIEMQLAETRDKLRAVAEASAHIERLTAERVDASERQGAAKSENDRLRREMAEIKTRMEALRRVGALCPACGRELLEADRVRLLADWEGQGRARGDQFRQNETLTKQLADRREAIERELLGLTHLVKTGPAIQRDETQLELRLSVAQDAVNRLPAAGQEADTLTQQLASGNFAVDARAALATVETELEALGYDSVAHKQLRERRLPELAAFADRKARLDRAALGRESETRAIGLIDTQAVALRQRIASEQATLDRLSAELRTSEAALGDASGVATRLQAAQSALFDAQRRVGAANQRVQACRALEGTHTRLSAEISELSRAQADCEQLQEAFGRNGVPAMIIESVLPELETSANGLLGRMSNGRMNVRFETQRLTQKGEASETLEIRISDELGERAYELFSGGEAFRINFAVRIALSRLLAHRAGARLQSLFIDEGFGTQDAQGRERLIEAVRAIEHEFSRIVVITHIDELRDAFPSRIEVSKSARGSIARVV